MKTLVKKMESLGLLKFQLIFYSILTILLVLAIPITIIILDVSLLLNPVVLGLIAGAILIFGLPGYFTFARPYFVYRKLPQVLAETDGEFLYIHGKKEVKIPLKDLENSTVSVDVPYIFQPGFLREFIVHIFSSKYGDVILDVPNYGEFKMQFVADAQEVANALIYFISDLIDNNK